MSIGIFSLSCCEGCSVQFLNLEGKLLEVLKYYNIENFRLAKELNSLPVDIAFVEGTPTTAEEVKKLLKIRRDSNVLVALGTCAATGGVPGLVNTMSKREAMKVYDSNPPYMPVDPKPIDYYVPVEHKLYGCPFSKDELMELITAVIMNKSFKNRESSVCVECALRENACLLDKGELCMGPVTRAGCRALCPSNGAPCRGCRGPYEDANYKAHIRTLMDMGITREEIIEAYSMFSYEPLKEVIAWLKEQ
ncbi:MAG: NADH:ubiquinone oxidoreductase [Euryarchaeota archaeon]|nr:NADH:ubiquinone oxidoreductase [Euryarchaeota archaeon]